MNEFSDDHPYTAATTHVINSQVQDNSVCITFAKTSFQGTLQPRRQQRNDLAPQRAEVNKGMIVAAV